MGNWALLFRIVSLETKDQPGSERNDFMGQAPGLCKIVAAFKKVR